jgi:hypothetical protein
MTVLLGLLLGLLVTLGPAASAPANSTTPCEPNPVLLSSIDLVEHPELRPPAYAIVATSALCSTRFPAESRYCCTPAIEAYLAHSFDEQGKGALTTIATLRDISEGMILEYVRSAIPSRCAVLR